MAQSAQAHVVDSLLTQRVRDAESEFQRVSWCYFNALGSKDAYIERGTPTGQPSSRLHEIERELRRAGEKLRHYRMRVRLDGRI